MKLEWDGPVKIFIRYINIFISPQNAGYNHLTFSVLNPLILSKSFHLFYINRPMFGKILLLFSYKSIDIGRNSDVGTKA